MENSFEYLLQDPSDQFEFGSQSPDFIDLSNDISIHKPSETEFNLDQLFQECHVAHKQPPMQVPIYQYHDSPPAQYQHRNADQSITQESTGSELFVAITNSDEEISTVHQEEIPKIRKKSIQKSKKTSKMTNSKKTKSRGRKRQNNRHYPEEIFKREVPGFDQMTEAQKKRWRRKIKNRITA